MGLVGTLCENFNVQSDSWSVAQLRDYDCILQFFAVFGIDPNGNFGLKIGLLLYTS